MLRTDEKQQMKAKIDRMSVEELSEIAEYTFQALRNISTKESSGKAKQKVHENEESIYLIFEREFGRLLSPMEIETLTMWIEQDGHEEPLIKYALREAVIAGKTNIKYIDRILLNWKKSGVKSVEQAEMQSIGFKGLKQKPSPNEGVRKGPPRNWLEEGL